MVYEERSADQAVREGLRPPQPHGGKHVPSGGGEATTLSERVEILSRRSIRDKLLCYFTMQCAKVNGNRFTLPFSLSALADYISTDRSAMMRELKKMREERLVDVEGRKVTLLRPTC